MAAEGGAGASAVTISRPDTSAAALLAVVVLLMMYKCCMVAGAMPYNERVSRSCLSMVN